MIEPLQIRRFDDLQDYETIWQMMRDFVNVRDANTPDELWLLEHSPVFTQGQAGKPEHILNPHAIPVVQSDRVGQVTYHGPGQLVGYCLFDLKRRGIGIKSLVCQIEKALLAVLSELDIQGHLQDGAPGVYVNQEKIASLGLRVRNGYTYHGFSLNVDMDLTPFGYINPCGFQGMKMCQLTDFKDEITVKKVGALCVDAFTQIQP